MSLPHEFTNGTVADADEVNANFTHLFKRVGFNNLTVYDTPTGNPHTFTVPAGVTRILVEVVGGGGQGGGSNTDGTGDMRLGGGGSAGGYCLKIIDCEPSDEFSIIVGAKGNPAAEGGNGGTGGTSSISKSAVVVCEATGGMGGLSGASTANTNQLGGVGIDGDLNFRGGRGEPNRRYSRAVVVATELTGGSSFFSGQGGPGAGGRGRTVGGSGGAGSGVVGRDDAQPGIVLVWYNN